jgi:hypothetical protein
MLTAYYVLSYWSSLVKWLLMLKSKITKLLLRKDTIRSLAVGELAGIHGGAINQTKSVCMTECAPGTQNDCLSNQCVLTDNCGQTYVCGGG